MRSSGDLFRGACALVLSVALAGCGLVGGADRPAAAASLALPANGPAADYPMVLGEPFTIDGVEYTPSDAMNHDEVGYATLDAEAGPGVTVSHKTLPLPSYVEVTSLDSGRTILARVERRGPMTNARVVGLSPDAQAQLGAGEGTPVRVRRVNPPEIQRADLRADRTAPLRMDTPETLLGVLRRKLPKDGSASLADARQAPVPSGVQLAGQPASADIATSAIASVPLPPAPERATAEDYALAPLGTAASPQPAASSPVQPATASSPGGEFVVQAATFASEANAARAAEALGGFIARAGRYYRVRTGPYTSRGQAEAALAKVRAAGYSDAKVSTAG
jgi:rare lipoprotein A